MSYTAIKGEKMLYDPLYEGLSDAAWRVLIILWIGPGRTMIGVREFVVEDLGPRLLAWNKEKLEQAFVELVEKRLVLHDPAQRMIYIRAALEYGPDMKSSKQLMGAANKLAEFPDSPVLMPVVEYILGRLPQAMDSTGNSKIKDGLHQIYKDLKRRIYRLQEPNTNASVEGETLAGYPIDRVSGLRLQEQKKKKKKKKEQYPPQSPPTGSPESLSEILGKRLGWGPASEEG